MDAIGSFESRAAGLSNEFLPILKEGMLQCDYSRFGPAIYMRCDESSLRRMKPSRVFLRTLIERCKLSLWRS